MFTMHTNHAITNYIIALSLAILNFPVLAAQITPISITAPPAGSGFYNANYLIDNSGLSGTAPNQIHNENGGAGSYVTSGTTATLTFDLGITYQVSAVQVWQYSTGDSDTNRGAKDIQIQYSTDNSTYMTDSTITVAVNTAGVSMPKQEFNLANTRSARYIRFNIQSNYGGSLVGLAEVKFSGIAIVPAPIDLNFSKTPEIFASEIKIK